MRECDAGVRDEQGMGCVVISKNWTSVGEVLLSGGKRRRIAVISDLELSR
jgi:hypothetical protein